MSDDLSGDMLAPSWPNLVLILMSHLREPKIFGVLILSSYIKMTIIKNHLYKPNGNYEEHFK